MKAKNLLSGRWPTAILVFAVMLALATPASAGSAQAQHTSGVFHGHYYAAFFDALTWPDAAAHCEQEGGHLATITSEAENQFVYDLLPDNVDSAWLGGSDEAVEGTWEWVTGEPLTYTNWGENEPNNDAPSGNPLLGEDYLTFHGRDAYDPPALGVWNDWQYEEDDTLSMLPFVCEFTTPAVAAQPPEHLAIFSSAPVTLTNNDVWECPDGTTASAYIETGFVIGDVLKAPINAGKPDTWKDADIWSVVIEGCGSDRFEFGPAFSGDLTGHVTTDQMAMETYEWAILDIGPIPYFSEDWVFTGVWATFDLEWQATGKPETVHGTEFLGVNRYAPASVTGTVTVYGLPAWHTGWDGSIAFVADLNTEGWLGREVQIAR